MPTRHYATYFIAGNTNSLFRWLKECEAKILLFSLCIIFLGKRAMGDITVVFALDLADADEQPMHVTLCDDIRDPIWSRASSLMQDMLYHPSFSSDPPLVEYNSISLSDQQENAHTERIREKLQSCKIFDEHGHFSVARVTEGPLVDLFGVGVGSNWKKRERACRLALAVAAAVLRIDGGDWLASQAIRVDEDAFSCARDTDAPNGLAAQPVRHYRQEARSRSPQRRPVQRHAPPEPVHIHSIGAGGNRRPQGAEPRLKKLEPPWHRAASSAHEKLLDDDDDDKEEEEVSAEEDPGGSDPVCVRPPDQWLLIYDYDKRKHFYWHPITMKSRWNPPPGSYPVSRRPELDTLGGVTASVRDSVIAAVQGGSRVNKFSRASHRGKFCGGVR